MRILAKNFSCKNLTARLSQGSRNGRYISFAQAETNNCQDQNGEDVTENFLRNDSQLTLSRHGSTVDSSVDKTGILINILAPKVSVPTLNLKVYSWPFSGAKTALGRNFLLHMPKKSLSTGSIAWNRRTFSDVKIPKKCDPNYDYPYLSKIFGTENLLMRSDAYNQALIEAAKRRAALEEVKNPNKETTNEIADVTIRPQVTNLKGWCASRTNVYQEKGLKPQTSNSNSTFAKKIETGHKKVGQKTLSDAWNADKPDILKNVSPELRKSKTCPPPTKAQKRAESTFKCQSLKGADNALKQPISIVGAIKSNTQFELKSTLRPFKPCPLPSKQTDGGIKRDSPCKSTHSLTTTKQRYKPQLPKYCSKSEKTKNQPCEGLKQGSPSTPSSCSGVSKTNVSQKSSPCPLSSKLNKVASGNCKKDDPCKPTDPSKPKDPCKEGMEKQKRREAEEQKKNINKMPSGCVDPKYKKDDRCNKSRKSPYKMGSVHNQMRKRSAAPYKAVKRLKGCGSQKVTKPNLREVNPAENKPSGIQNKADSEKKNAGADKTNKNIKIQDDGNKKRDDWCSKLQIKDDPCGSQKVAKSNSNEVNLAENKPSGTQRKDDSEKKSAAGDKTNKNIKIQDDGSKKRDDWCSKLQTKDGPSKTEDITDTSQRSQNLSKKANDVFGKNKKENSQLDGGEKKNPCPDKKSSHCGNRRRQSTSPCRRSDRQSLSSCGRSDRQSLSPCGSQKEEPRKNTCVVGRNKDSTKDQKYGQCGSLKRESTSPCGSRKEESIKASYGCGEKKDPNQDKRPNPCGSRRDESIKDPCRKNNQGESKNQKEDSCKKNKEEKRNEDPCGSIEKKQPGENIKPSPYGSRIEEPTKQPCKACTSAENKESTSPSSAKSASKQDSEKLEKIIKINCIDMTKDMPQGDHCKTIMSSNKKETSTSCKQNTNANKECLKSNRVTQPKKSLSICSLPKVETTKDPRKSAPSADKVESSCTSKVANQVCGKPKKETNKSCGNIDKSSSTTSIRKEKPIEKPCKSFASNDKKETSTQCKPKSKESLSPCTKRQETSKDLVKKESSCKPKSRESLSPCNKKSDSSQVCAESRGSTKPIEKPCKSFASNDKKETSTQCKPKSRESLSPCTKRQETSKDLVKKESSCKPKSRESLSPCNKKSDSSQVCAESRGSTKPNCSQASKCKEALTKTTCKVNASDKKAKVTSPCQSKTSINQDCNKLKRDTKPNCSTKPGGSSSPCGKREEKCTKDLAKKEPSSPCKMKSDSKQSLDVSESCKKDSSSKSKEALTKNPCKVNASAKDLTKKGPSSPCKIKSDSKQSLDVSESCKKDSPSKSKESLTKNPCKVNASAKKTKRTRACQSKTSQTQNCAKPKRDTKPNCPNMKKGCSAKTTTASQSLSGIVSRNLKTLPSIRSSGLMRLFSSKSKDKNKKDDIDIGKASQCKSVGLKVPIGRKPVYNPHPNEGLRKCYPTYDMDCKKLCKDARKTDCKKYAFLEQTNTNKRKGEFSKDGFILYVFCRMPVKFSIAKCKHSCFCKCQPAF